MLKITKKGDKYWLFEDSQIGEFSPSKFTINLLNNDITIVYENGLKSKTYNVIDCEIYDLGSLVPFTTSSGNDFMAKLEELNCPCFQKNENVYNGIVGTLQQVTDIGNVTTNNITIGEKLIFTAGAEISDDGAEMILQHDLGISLRSNKDGFQVNFVSAPIETLTDNVNVRLPNDSGTISTREWVNSKIYDIIKLGVTTNATPNDGDVWLESNTNTGLKIRINGVTKTINLS